MPIGGAGERRERLGWYRFQRKSPTPEDETTSVQHRYRPQVIPELSLHDRSLTALPDVDLIFAEY